MPLPDVRLEWHPTQPWNQDVTAGTWVTINRGWREMVFGRGVNEHSERTEASTIDITLDDHDRSLDPTNRMGPNWGNLLPRRHLRVVLTIAAVDYTLWRGYTTGFYPDWSLNDASTRITGVDLLGLMAEVGMPTSYLRAYLATLAPKWDLPLDESGGSIAYSYGADRTPWSHQSVNLAAGPLIPYDPGGSVSYGDTGFARTSYGALDRIAPPCTVVFWMSLEQGTNKIVDPYAQGQGGTSGFPDGDLGFRIQTNGQGLMGVADGTRSAYVKTGALDLSRPVFICGRYTEIAGVPTLKMRVDTLDAVATHAAPLIYPRNGPAYLGNSIPLDRPFVGQLAGFRRWDRYLSDDEVSFIYLAGTYPLDGQRTDERIVFTTSYAGLPAALVNLDVGESLMGPWKMDAKALENVARAVATERGRMFVDRDGRLTFHRRHHVGTVRGVYSTKPEKTAGGGLMNLSVGVDTRSLLTVATAAISTPVEVLVTYRHPNAEVLGEVPWTEPTAFRNRADADAAVRDVVRDGLPENRLSDATSRYGAPGVDPTDLLLTEIGDRTTLVGHPPDDADPAVYGPFVTWGGTTAGTGADAGDGWGATSADDGWGGPAPIYQDSVVLGLTHHLDGRALTYDVTRTTVPYRES